MREFFHGEEFKTSLLAGERFGERFGEMPWTMRIKITPLVMMLVRNNRALFLFFIEGVESPSSPNPFFHRGRRGTGKCLKYVFSCQHKREWKISFFFSIIHPKHKHSIQFNSPLSRAKNLRLLAGGEGLSLSFLNSVRAGFVQTLPLIAKRKFLNPPLQTWLY